MTLLAALLFAFAQDADRVQDLIRKLGSEDYAVREQATEELRKIGAPAREALRKAAESDDPEIRERAQRLLQAPPPPERPAPPPRRGVPLPPPVPGVPGQPGFRGGSVSVQSVNGNATYLITPGDGSPPLKFFKAVSGQVKLEYQDEQGETKTADAPSLESFLKDQKELAAKYGITEEGIDYGGSRVSFKGPAFGNFRFAPPPRRLPDPAPGPDEEAHGASFGPVDESLRAQLELPEGGAVVLRVEPGSVAQKLGLRKSDVVLEADGRKVSSPADLAARLRADGSATVLRKGRRETLKTSKDF